MAKALAFEDAKIYRTAFSAALLFTYHVSILLGAVTLYQTQSSVCAPDVQVGQLFLQDSQQPSSSLVVSRERNAVLPHQTATHTNATHEALDTARVEPGTSGQQRLSRVMEPLQQSGCC